MERLPPTKGDRMGLDEDRAELQRAWAELRASFVAALPATLRGRMLLLVGMLVIMETTVLVCWLAGVR